MKEFEYCTNKVLLNDFGKWNYTKFDGIVYFAAWFSSRRLGHNSKRAYRLDLRWANMTVAGKAFGKLPQDLYED